MPGTSDSDLYVDMARVFTGDAEDFNRIEVGRAPHHYNRPLFPFLAGYVAKYFLRGNLRAGFSIVNIIAATVLAMLFFRVVWNQRRNWSLYWVPPILFLSGFPQLNWGYHLLTDTLGLSTAFAAACLAARLVRVTGDNLWTSHFHRSIELAALFVTSAAAFLTRETAWIAVVTTGWLIFSRRAQWKTHWFGFGLIVLALIAGKVPHSIYAHLWQVSGVPLRSTLDDLLDPRHMLDFVVKTGVCFNVSWVLALLAIIKRKSDLMPPLVVGWSIAAILYMGAGYVVNNQANIGYPLRMSYSLFPLIFIGAGEFFESFAADRKRLLLAIVFCLVHFGIGLMGVFLDPGRHAFRTTEALKALKEFFF